MRGQVIGQLLNMAMEHSLSAGGMGESEEAFDLLDTELDLLDGDIPAVPYSGEMVYSDCTEGEPDADIWADFYYINEDISEASSKYNNKGEVAMSKNKNNRHSDDEFYEKYKSLIRDEESSADETEDAAPEMNCDTLDDLAANADGEPIELDAEPEQEQHTARNAIDKLMTVMTLVLAVMLLGGSMVFWYVVIKNLSTSPYALADPTEMLVLMITCAVVPLAVLLTQLLLGRGRTFERWLINMVISGIASTLIVAIVQGLVRSVGFELSELITLICCAVSGCALPAFLYFSGAEVLARLGDRVLFENSKNWEEVRRDVLSLTDFKLK